MGQGGARQPRSQGPFLPLDIVSVAQIVALSLLLHVVKDGHGSHEIDNLSRGQQEKVGPAVTAPIPVSAAGGHGSRGNARGLGQDVWSQPPSTPGDPAVSRIHPVQLQLLVWQLQLGVQAVGGHHGIGDKHGDGASPEEHFHVTILCRAEGEGGKAR